MHKIVNNGNSVALTGCPLLAGKTCRAKRGGKCSHTLQQQMVGIYMHIQFKILLSTLACQPDSTSSKMSTSGSGGMEFKS